MVVVLGWDVFRFCLIPPAELWDRSKASKNQVWAMLSSRSI